MELNFPKHGEVIYSKQCLTAILVRKVDAFVYPANPNFPSQNCPVSVVHAFDFSRLKARQFCVEFSGSIGKESQLRLAMSGTSQAGLLNST